MNTKPTHVTVLNRLLQAQLLGALAVLPAVAQIPNAPMSAGITTQISRHQHAPLRIHERRYDGTVTSENWSGYAVTGSNITDVKGSWIVPAVTCPLRPHRQDRGTSLNRINTPRFGWASMDIPPAPSSRLERIPTVTAALRVITPGSSFILIPPTPSTIFR